VDFIDEEIGNDRFIEVLLEPQDLKDLEDHGMAYLTIETKKKRLEVSVRIEGRPVCFGEEEQEVEV
jgi:negative regulator of genetic competence, sporulation and motility